MSNFAIANDAEGAIASANKLMLKQSFLTMLYLSITKRKIMHTTNLRKVGGSIMLAIPPAVLEILNLQSGTTVGVAVDNGRLIIEPQLKPQYSLDELLAQCNSNAPITEDDRVWLDVKPVGNEL